MLKKLNKRVFMYKIILIYEMNSLIYFFFVNAFESLYIYISK